MEGLGLTEALAEQAGGQTTRQSTSPGGALGKDEFLKLLVTQLSNQDPMNPMNGQEFAAQLAQFTSVEQLMNISDVLAQNSEMNGILAQSINSGVAAGLIGKSVEAAGNTIGWDGETPSEMNFELASPASNVTITVRNAAGLAVRTFELGARTGEKHAFEWDGTTASGATAATGTYTFEVAAVDATGKAVTVQTFTRGTVDRVTFGKDGIRLWLGTHSVAMSDVSSVE